MLTQRSLSNFTKVLFMYIAPTLKATVLVPHSGLFLAVVFWGHLFPSFRASFFVSLLLQLPFQLSFAPSPLQFAFLFLLSVNKIELS